MCRLKAQTTVLHDTCRLSQVGKYAYSCYVSTCFKNPWIPFGTSNQHAGPGNEKPRSQRVAANSKYIEHFYPLLTSWDQSPIGSPWFVFWSEVVKLEQLKRLTNWYSNHHYRAVSARHGCWFAAHFASLQRWWCCGLWEKWHGSMCLSEHFDPFLPCFLLFCFVEQGDVGPSSILKTSKQLSS